MLFSIKRCLFVGLLVGQLTTLAPIAAAEPPSAAPLSARRLFVQGSERMLWLSVAEYEKDAGDLVNHFYYRDSTTDQIYPAAIPPQLEPIHKAAVAGGELHVFYKSRAHYVYTKDRAWRAHQLPNRALPLALAGETIGRIPRLWAVVPGNIGDEVNAQWRLKNLEADPKSADQDSLADASEPASPAVSPADRTLQIVMYDGIGWQPGIKAPPECPATDYMWLAVADGRFYLFWLEPDDQTIVHYARYEEGEWTRGPEIHAANFVHRVVTAVVNKQVVFAALLKAPDEQTRRCVQWTRSVTADKKSAWALLPPLLDEQGKQLGLTKRTALGLFGDRLVLAQMSPDKPPDIGVWLSDHGGKPQQPFKSLPIISSSEGTPQTNNVREFITTIVVATMLLLVFWRRQESFGMVLPPGLQVVGPAKRTLAFLIDAAPAAIIVLLLWHDPISAFYHEINSAAAPNAAAQRLEPPAEVLWAWFWFRVIYTAWCTGFECFLSATLGKRLLGCHVLSENLESASLLQLGIRNVARMVELEPYLKIWPFLFVVFFTRNRQRMGDLLARTIVVERQHIVLPDSESHAPPPPDNSDYS